MRSLGRYMFGQPHFYIALALFLNSPKKKLIENKKNLTIVTIVISSISLLINFVDFGSAKLVP